MLSNASLLISLWTYALKTTMYLQNRVPTKAAQKTPFELWTRRKPSLRHLHVWGCPAEIRYYNPQQKKLDARTISGYFIGYPEKSKGFRFYCPNHTTRIIESGNARFIENDEVSERETPRKVDIKEMRVQIPLTCIPNQAILPPIVTQVIEPINKPDEQYEGQINDLITHNEIAINEPRVDEPQPIALRRSQRENRSAIPNDYVVYLHKSESDLGIENDLVTFSQAMNDVNSNKWLEAMKDELKSMVQNEVWDLIELPEGRQKVGCKWVFKTKRDSHGNLERYMASLVAKGFIQKDDVNYEETFSPVSKKYSFRIIMALVAHYDLELHQMGMKTTFLNRNLNEEVYMDQPMGFIEEGKEHMVCKLKRSIYGLKQAS